MIVRYITHHDLHDYRHWRVSYYGERGDGLLCFVASFQCEATQTEHESA